MEIVIDERSAVATAFFLKKLNITVTVSQKPLSLLSRYFACEVNVETAFGVTTADIWVDMEAF